MTNELIISIDPGDKYIGVYAYYEKTFMLTQLQRSGNLSEDFELMNSCLNSIKNKFLITHDTLKTIIIEKFTKYSHLDNINGYKENKTSELIGCIQQWALTNNFNIIMQTASIAKFWDNNRLVKKELMNIKGKNYFIGEIPIPKHTRDAYRHFISYVNKKWFEGYITKEKLYGYEI